MPSITAEVFKSIFQQVSVSLERFYNYTDGQASNYMGISTKDEPIGKRKNFSSDVLRIELHGPTRSHFGILDVPGIFHAVTDTVTKEDMERVTAMVKSHMQRPENVIM